MDVTEIRVPREGGQSGGGILALPHGGGPFPGVIVIGTISGLDKFAAYAVGRLADDGFAALSVDFFDHPGVPSDPHQRFGGQPDQEVMSDLDAGLRLLENHPQVHGEPIFTWGYCLGGRFALLWPTYQPRLAGAVSFHGFPTNDTTNPNMPTQPIDRLDRLTAPIRAFFGEADMAVPLTEVERFRKAITAHGKEQLVQTHVYPGAKHMWTNPYGERYDAEAAEDCWRRGVEFMRAQASAARGATTSG